MNRQPGAMPQQPPMPWAPPSQQPPTAPLPYFYQLAPGEEAQAVDNAARRLAELQDTAFELMFNAATGWEQLPRRQKFALLATKIREFDQQAQLQGVMLPMPGLAYFAMLTQIDARKGAELAKFYGDTLKAYGSA